MAIISSIVFSFLALQMLTMATPSGNNIVTPSNHATLDTLHNEKASQINIENDSDNNKRQKRFYDYIDFRYPPFYPGSVYPPYQKPYSKRDESEYTGVYGTDESFTQIFRRLREILADAKQYAQTPPAPSPPPPVTHFTGYIPLFYLPQAIGGCSCTNAVHHNTPTQPQPSVDDNKQPRPDTQTTRPDTQTTQPATETTKPSLDNRFLGEKGQNWGILVNSSDPIVNLDNDGKRPISFVPVITDEDIDIPLPPVEHGSFQAGLEPELTTTTKKSPSDSRPITTTTKRTSTNVRPLTTRRYTTYLPPTTPKSDAKPSYTTYRPQSRTPSVCDEAVITCCLQSYNLPNCFAQNNCPDTSIYGQPCSSEVLVNVIKKKLYYIEQRNAANV